MDRIIKENKQKLQNSIMMGNEFKNKIVDQQNLISDLQRELYSERSIKEQLQSKLDQYIVSQADQQLDFENKETEQLKKIILYEEEIQKLRDANNYLRRIVSDQKIDIKKYEFEVEMLYDDNHQQTKEFLTQLQMDDLQNQKNDEINKLQRSISREKEMLQKANSQKSYDYQQFNNDDIYRNEEVKSMDQSQIYENNQNYSIDNQRRQLYPQFMNQTVNKINKYQSQKRLLGSNVDTVYQNSNLDRNLSSNQLLSPKTFINQRQTPCRGGSFTQNDFRKIISPKNLNYPTQDLTAELEMCKSGRSQARLNLEKRIQMLSENLEQDLAQSKNKNTSFYQ
ncbi:hypothetical protein PPERSA_06894 [Pseudocohnilembus persalinus]|uniref:Uncharacterized protein n=1 Tax=Pseudocohnilembus persalinus TaxID=266149 RepID=A0A0V0QY63_PSEPJ|nr:hypothetical protein PPERSA_06894 [Pseudocohnilembus persalinus]|eukprot:KRX07279.1 hypothetical protein PPERSA_06894 [Pseudocohnilembus persalinus]